MAMQVNDAADDASMQINARASWHNNRRCTLPPLINEYCAVLTSNVVEWKTGPDTSTKLLAIPSTGGDFDSLYWVFPYFQSTSPIATSGFSSLNFANFAADALMLERLRLTYDEYRIRSMKFIFEPVLTQPLTNTQPLSAYAWFPPNPVVLDLNNPQNEYGNFDELRNEITGGNTDFRRLSSSWGTKFVCEFIPQCYMRNDVGGVGQAQVQAFSLVPAPWLSRDQNTVNMYSPVFVFRRPFAVAPTNFTYQVTIRACFEFRKPNPDAEA